MSSLATSRPTPTSRATSSRPTSWASVGGGFVIAYNNAEVFDGFIALNFYDADREVIGGHQLAHATGGQTSAYGQPKLTELADGSVLVVWDDDDANLSKAGPRGSIYSQAGDVVAEDIDLFAAESSTSYGHVDVAALHDEGFVVAYEFGDEIWFRAFNSAGEEEGTVVQVNTVTSGDQDDPQVTVLADGAFAVVWTDYGTGTAQIKARIYEADGEARTDEFNCSPGAGYNTGPSIAATRNGGFAVVYTDTGWVEGGAGTGAGITLNVVAADGTVGASTHVNQTTPTDELEADVTVLENGFIAVTWTYPFLATDKDLDFRVFNQLGVAVTGDLALAGSTSDEMSSAVSALGGGKFITSWESEVSDGALGQIGSQVTEILRTVAGDVLANAFTGDLLRDSISGLAGNDTLNGGAGADTIDGGDDFDLIDGGGDHDSLSGGEGADTIDGGAGNDRIFGIGTSLSAGDLLRGGVGADRIKGGAGGGFDGDTLEGGVGDDKLDGGGSSDLLEGGDGSDKLKGQAGADTLEGGASSDTLDGGVNDDRLYAATAAAIDGSAIGDTISGGGGEDRIYGSAGSDSLLGAQGKDRIEGRADDDTIDGGAGSDLLTGGAGADRLTGGVAKDIFVFTDETDSIIGMEDLITDLDTTDRINLSGIDAKAGKDNDQAFNLVSAFSGEQGELVIAFHATGDYAGLTTIEGDVDGDGVADLIITVTGNLTNFSSFVL